MQLHLSALQSTRLLPSLRRARLLQARTEIASAARDAATARAAADELARIAEAQASTALEASVSSALGIASLAAGKSSEALGRLRQACLLWIELDVPYDAARVRSHLATALHALNDKRSAAFELEAAQAVFERLGARPDTTGTARALAALGTIDAMNAAQILWVAFASLTHYDRIKDQNLPISVGCRPPHVVTVRRRGSMLFFFRSGLLLGRVMVAAGLVVMTVALAASSSEALFLAENQAAMEKMMTGMKATPSGDVDHDFIAMMIPHHQGAIDMAQAELRYGHNEQLRRLAQEIIVAQQQEIAAMRLAVGEPLPPSTAAPDQVQGAAAVGPGPPRPQ